MDDVSQIRRFINEYIAATGSDSKALFGLELPLPSRCEVYARSITIPFEQVVRFRNGYRLLLEFAALQCGRPIEELCPFDLIAPFLPKSEPDPDEEYL